VAEIFINYRTGDGDEVAAELITSSLSDRFGKEHVFKASHSLQPGDLFPQRLIDAARKSEVLLAVIGPEWALASQLRDEADWVRKEILAAQSSGASVIPVLKGRKTDRLVRADLPPELRWLADVHSLRLDTHDSTADLGRIGDFLADLVPTLKAADRSARDATAAGSITNSADNVKGGNVVQGRDFTGDMRNVKLTDTHGPTTIGDNNNTQNNFLSYVAHVGARLRAARARQSPVDQLRWLAERFVPPPGFSKAVAAIDEYGTVILDGPPGSGRATAAQMLLLKSWSGNGLESWPGKGKLQELPVQEPGDEPTALLSPDDVGTDDRVWVDLSDADPLFWRKVQRELPTLRARVIECRARLVLIKPDRDDLQPEFRLYHRRIGLPPPFQVFRHLLRVEGLLPPGEDVDPPKVIEAARSMDDVRRFIDDILDAKDQPGIGDSLANWIAAAGEPTSPREKQVAEVLSRLPRAAQRALLLSTAMLHGAHTDVIDRGCAALLASLSDESGTALERLPLGQRLRAIEAEVDAAGHVYFVAARYEIAVRTFFWRHYPELHDALTTWVRDILDSDGLRDEDREELARGFTDQCLEQRYQARWIDLVEHLTPRANLSRMSAAVAILQRGLSDENSGRTFRRQIYQWSRASHVPDSLAAVLVAACGEMACTHPDEALVRLHHVARRHPKRNVGARDALASHARSDLQLLVLLLSRLTSAYAVTTQQADASIFLNIADAPLFTARQPTSEPLITQGDIARQLTAGWTLAFNWLPTEEWASRAHDWLRCAAEDEANRHVLVDVLIDGARHTPVVLSQLYGIAHRAAFRDVIADVVLNKISAVQGVDLP
jgi:hypothetical protein